MSSEAQDSTEQQASALADASFQALFSSWKAVLHSFKLKLNSHSELVAADFHLSIKALAVAAGGILILVGLALILWSTLLLAMTYGLALLGVHWLISVSLVIALNLAALYLVKHITSAAMKSISMKATAEALLSSEEGKKET